MFTPFNFRIYCIFQPAVGMSRLKNSTVGGWLRRGWVLSMWRVARWSEVRTAPANCTWREWSSAKAVNMRAVNEGLHCGLCLRNKYTDSEY